MHKKFVKKTLFTLIALIALSAAVVFALLYNGIIHINNPPPNSVIGVDVSSYQGEIDWETLADQNISFAFIKATEGSSFVDPYFHKNWENAARTDLRIGAYHFFSFESPGEKQAESFCGNVTPADGMLPPAVDVEYYGSFKSAKDIDADAVARELRALVDHLTDEYGVKPIIYATKESCETILKNNFGDCDLWIRSVYGAPSRETDWTFWQYSSRYRLKGYVGKERYIDMNVFCGDSYEFAAYPNDKQ